MLEWRVLTGIIIGIDLNKKIQTYFVVINHLLREKGRGSFFTFTFFHSWFFAPL